MHVLIVSCVFPPEPVTSAITSEHLAAGLVAAGHTVTVLTGFPSRPAPELYPEVHPRWRAVEQAPGGYTIIRSWSVPSTRSRAGSRLLENLTFGLSSTLNSLSVRPDVVYANSWPIFATGMLAAACTVRRLPFVVSVQDIHPEAPILLGKLPATGVVPTVMRHIDRWVVHRAAAVITIAPNFNQFYQQVRQVPASKMHTIPNWLDEREIVPGPRMGAFRRRLGIPEQALVAMYAGNVGAVAGVETLVRMAALLKDHPTIWCVIVGEGSELAACKALAASLHIPRLCFVPPVTRGEFPAVQAAADVLLLPTKSGGALSSVPSKLIAYMLSARAVLAGVDAASDTARIIDEAGCGRCVPTENPQALADQLIAWAGGRARFAPMGERGRQYAVTHFSRQACVARLVKVLEQLSHPRVGMPV